MTVFIFALSSAFFIGLGNVLTRKALNSNTRTQAIVFSLMTSVFVFWILAVLFVDLSTFLVPGILLFALAGLLGAGLGRVLNITSLSRIGVARSIPITGTAPFFATIAAILFLGESYTLYLFLGTVFILVGIYVVSRRKKSDGKVFSKKDLLLPLGSAFFGGLSMAISKKALGLVDDPIAGAALSGTTALVVILMYMVVTGRLQKLQTTKSVVTFPVLAGLAMTAAFLLNLNALKIGDVSMVAPVFSTFPLFGVFLSHFILKEQITARMWLGAIIIIVGVAVIQVF